LSRAWPSRDNVAEFRIERSLLEKLERLTLAWQRSFPGAMGGQNRSLFAGAGQEFLDHRNFHPGDDLRAVNWQAYLRLEKMFLKIFHLEPRVPVRFLLDCSESMLCGSKAGEPSKFDAGRMLTAAMTYVALVRLEQVKLMPFRDQLQEGITCSGGRHRFGPAGSYIEGLSAEGRTDFHTVVRQLLNSQTQPGLLIIMSDFLDPAGCEKPLQYLADFGHELCLVQLFGSEDREGPVEGEIELEDPESGEKVEARVDAETRTRWRAAFDEYAGKLRQVALRNRGRALTLPAATPLEEALFGSLMRSGVVR
jgi:uncharacterized protein (DUF58 family)